MDELLQKLLEAEVLSEDTRKELHEAFEAQLQEAIAAAKESAAAEVRAELTEQWIKERDTLVEAVDEKVGDFLRSEMEELTEDINKFRDLEAEMAEKLVEEKAAMRNELKHDLSELVEQLDVFLEIRLAAEMEELREDIEAQRQNDFGRRIYEAFADEYMRSYADDESIATNLHEAEKRLEDAQKALTEVEQERDKLMRTMKMNEVLAPLTGRPREVMEAILRNVDTANLESGYKTFIGRVLRETPETPAGSEKEGKVLAEGEEKTAPKKDAKKALKEGTARAVTGDNIEEEKSLIEESQKQPSTELERLRRLAGIV